MVVPLVEALLLRAVRRRSPAPTVRPTRLVGPWHDVDSLGYVAERTSVLRLRPGSPVEVLPAGSLVLPPLLGRPPAYAVVSHEPVDVWLRIGPFDTLDDRTLRQVELRLTVALSDSPAGLRDVLASVEVPTGPGGPPGTSHAPGDLDLGELVLGRLAHEVSDRTTAAVRRRSLAELTGLSVAVLLDGALPATFLGGLVGRTALEVVDVDWPTEGRGWPPAPPSAAEAATGAPDPVHR